MPADLWTIYNFNPAFAAGYSGQGQTIVVIEDTDLYTTADWNTFRSTFGLASAYPLGSLTQVHPASSPTNNCTDPGVNGDDDEAALDVEWASAGAPSAAIELASCADTATNFGGFIALQNLLNASGTPPAIVSISYGESESVLGASFNAYINSLYQQAVTEGVSVFVSSGDMGAASSDGPTNRRNHRQRIHLHTLQRIGGRHRLCRYLPRHQQHLLEFYQQPPTTGRPFRMFRRFPGTTPAPVCCSATTIENCPPMARGVVWPFG